MATTPNGWSNSVDRPRHVTTDPSYNVYALGDYGSRDIYKYQSDGTEEWSTVVDPDEITSLDYYDAATPYIQVIGEQPTSGGNNITRLNANDGSIADTKQFTDEYAYVGEIASSSQNGTYYQREIGGDWYVIDYDTGDQILNPNGFDFISLAVDDTLGVIAGDTGGYIYQISTDLTTINSTIRPDSGGRTEHLEIGSDGKIYADSYGIYRIDPSNGLSVDWYTDRSNVTGLSYDGVDDELYVASTDETTRLDASTGNVKDWPTYTNIDENARDVASNGENTAIFALQLDSVDGSIDAVADSSWSQIQDTPTATQPSTIATTTHALVDGNYVIGATKVSAAASMNLVGFSATATQLSVSTTTNTAFAYEKAYATPVSASGVTNTTQIIFPVDATQPSAEVWLNSPSIEVEEPPWAFLDSGGQRFIADAVNLSNGEPQLKRGQEITLPFAFFKNRERTGTQHTETYQRFLETYQQNLTDNTVKTIETGRGVPRFTENINPLSDADSYLFELNVDDNFNYQKEWWVVVTDIEDDTGLRGPHEQLNITLYPLKPYDGETFDEIVDEFKV